MQQRRNGRQLIIAGIGVIVLVLAVALFFNRGGSSSNGKGGSGAATSTKPVVVALQSIPQGQTFTSGEPLSTFFTVKQEPTDLVPFGAYSSVTQINNFLKSIGCQPGKAPGCTGSVTTTQTIYQNMPVVAGMFSTLGQFRTQAGPAFQIPYGYVAIGVPFSAVNSVMGSIQPGDDIDLIGSIVGCEGTGACPKQTQYTLNDVRVIAVNGPIAPPVTTSSDKALGVGGSSSATSQTGANAPGTGGNLLVIVRYQQALIIQNMKDFGGTWTISAVLRSSKETDIPHFRTLPIFFRWYFVKQENHFDLTSPY